MEETQKTENSQPTDILKNEKFKFIIALLLITATTIYVTQSWKGDAGIPGIIDYDFPFHAYRMWFAADHISHGNFLLDFDFKTNTLFTRGYPALPYLAAAPFVTLFGLLGGVTYFVLFIFLVMGVGSYFLGKTLKLSSSTSIFLSVAVLMSYALVLESQYAGGIHRLFAFALFPWILAAYMRITDKNGWIPFSILIAGAFLSHQGVALSFLIVLSLMFLVELYQKTASFKQIKSLAFGGLFAVLLTAHYFIPMAIETSSGDLNRPGYLFENVGLLGTPRPAPLAFFDRNFGWVPTSTGNVSGYLGIAILSAALLGAIWSKNNLKIALLLCAAIFTYLLINPTIAPPLLQGMHYSRVVMLLSFFVSILAAFGVEEISSYATKKVEKTALIKVGLVGAMLLLVAVDFSPGWTAFPTSNYLGEKILDKLATGFTGNGRLYPGELVGGRTWFQAIDFPHRILLHSPELLNPEYASLMLLLQKNHKNPMSKENQGALFLLNIKRYIWVKNETTNITGIDIDAEVFEPPNAAVIFPSKTILIDTKLKPEAEKIFENILGQEYYHPNKIGFIIDPTEVSKDEVTYILSDESGEKHISIAELPGIFQNTKLGNISDINTNGKTLEFNSPGNGFAFISHQYYPHFKSNAGPLYEAGGGLTAVKVEKPGLVTIYWERQWYDYLAWAISLGTLALLVYFALNKNNPLDQFAKNQEEKSKVNGLEEVPN